MPWYSLINFDLKLRLLETLILVACEKWWNQQKTLLKNVRIRKKKAYFVVHYKVAHISRGIYIITSPITARISTQVNWTGIGYLWWRKISSVNQAEQGFSLVQRTRTGINRTNQTPWNIYCLRWATIWNILRVSIRKPYRRVAMYHYMTYHMQFYI